MQTQTWFIDKFIPYLRNPRKNDGAVEQMKRSITEFGFKIPILARSNGEVVDGHLRLKAARQLGMTELPVVLCDEWSEAQVKAFRLLVNRSATWADWDVDLVTLELEELRGLDFNLTLTGFDPVEIESFLEDEAQDELADSVPPAPAIPTSQLGDLWCCGEHRILCGDATNRESVATVLGEQRPLLMVTDPPYGIELDSEWRDRAATRSGSKYTKQRKTGHTETKILGDTRVDWSDAFALVPSLSVAYVWHASKYTREVLDGLLRIGFEHHQQIIWNKGRPVLTRTHYWFQHEPCWYVRKKNAPWYGKPGENSTIWESPSPKFVVGSSGEPTFDHPTQKPVALVRRPIVNHTRCGEVVYEPFLGSGTTLAAAELTGRVCCGLEIDPKYVDVCVQRWQQISGKQATLAHDGRTFDKVSEERQAKEAA